ncbi:cysteine dioxygenase type 1 [Sitodiplosis mosellana]|uniref:cysteine dioxygenase type 1 n=1 Tax=Sitodiplosis mosellana TaxID=263140 RepID=UPI002444780F|nr:cysteine dioxygenase type 1 [Sitodiplosis mosellana]XP_055320096.1 cysteine dioxygenase type 1 [Sitodiplosis mosellana]
MMQEITENSTNREQYLRELTKSFTGLEKPLKNATSPATLDELIAELHEVFRSDRVNIEYVNHLMLSYQSNPAEWKKFAKFDRFKYTRNLVDAGNGKFNLMILCWGEGHGSAIHDHADSHCFMKMLKGELREIRYAWPKNNSNCIEHNGSADITNQKDEEGNNEYNSSKLQELSRAIMETNSVHYINDTLGLHRVENPSHTNGAVSLHLYCPPYNSCSIFNEKTGKQSKCTVEFYSKYGQRRFKDAKMAPEDN